MNFYREKSQKESVFILWKIPTDNSLVQFIGRIREFELRSIFVLSYNSNASKFSLLKTVWPLVKKGCPFELVRGRTIGHCVAEQQRRRDSERLLRRSDWRDTLLPSMR